jgi:hypothetical protein
VDEPEFKYQGELGAHDLLHSLLRSSYAKRQSLGAGAIPSQQEASGGVVISTCMAIEQRSTSYNQSVQGKVRAAVIVGIAATELAGFN